MFLDICLLCFVLGVVFKYIISRLSSFLTIHISRSSFDSTTTDRTSQSYKDSFCVKIGPSSDVALQSLFDAIIDNYISDWYKILSSNTDFLIQVKLFLQHLSACLIQRARSVPFTGHKLASVLESFVIHVEHIILFTPGANNETNVLLEDKTLQSFGPHLHTCMISRHTEINYLRALVNRLLPIISLPPAFRSTSLNSSHPTLHGKQRGGDVQTPPLAKRNANRPMFGRSSSNSLKLGANPAAYGFFVEILSTCVLLPAMDSLADPDFINKLIILALEDDDESEEEKRRKFDTQKDFTVPVLHSYIQEWNQWLAKKPTRFKLEALLQNDQEFLLFSRYMKSIQSSIPLTAVILLRDINQRVFNGQLSSHMCQEIRTQLLHVLASLHGSADPSSELIDIPPKLSNLDTSVNLTSTYGSPRPYESLFGSLDGFECLLRSHLSEPVEIASLRHLIESSDWVDGCRSLFEAVGSRYLPMYLESPEYLSQFFKQPPGMIAGPRSSKLSHSACSSDKRKSIKSVVTNTNESIPNAQINTNPPEANSTKGGYPNANTTINGKLSNGTNSLKFTPSQQRSHAQTHKIDLSTWRVFIRGPLLLEKPHGPRLIDQIGMYSLDRSGREEPRVNRSRDARFNAKIAEELNQLRSGDRASYRRQPINISPPEVFVVNSERMVNGDRQLIAQVDRDSSEFYTLERKLIEFHGNSIIKQLPPRQLLKPSIASMESKCDKFEEFLQYLVSQKCLRNSELLYRFLTSESAFSTNVLFEFNLGRLAKSVLPNKRGRYLDKFLVDFYVSCSPEPLTLDSTERSRDETVVTVFPTSSFGTLGGLDALTTPNDYTMNPTRSSTTPLENVQRRSSDQIIITPPTKHGRELTWIDNRLRCKSLWNNAGLNWEQYRLCKHDLCKVSAPRFDDFFELICYIVTGIHLTHDGPVLPPRPSPLPLQSEPEQHNPIFPDAYPEIPTPPPVDPSDIMNDDWSEALLNGPTDLCMEIDSSSNGVCVPSTSSCDDASANKDPSPSFQSVHEDMKVVQSQMISIGWYDVVNTIFYLGRLFKYFLTIQLRRLVCWILFVLGTYFPTLADRLLCKWVLGLLRRLLADKMLSIALNELKEAVFSPTPVLTEADKLERRQQALEYLQQLALNVGVDHLLDEETVKNYLSRLFFCFQHPKWNKQLSYVLLDQLIIELFPELEQMAEV